MAKKYETLADSIVELVGGKDNIRFFTHCVTRLRFNVKDKGAVDIKAIEKLPGAIGVQWAGDQLQVIIGQEVSDAYALICSKNDLEKVSESAEKSEAKPAKKKNVILSAIDAISGCITPLLPMLIGGGMIRVILTLGAQLGFLPSDTPTYITLNYIADASIYFLPVGLGYTGAKKFGLNPAIGLLLAGVLISPKFIADVGTGEALSIFSLPIMAKTYGNSVFPMILTTFVASYVEKFLKKYSPNALKSVFVPTGTLLIMVPVMLVALAPIGSYLGTYLAEGLIWLYNAVGPLGVAIYSAFSCYLVVVGMHTVLTPFATQCIASIGYDPIVGPAKFVRDFDIGTAAFVVGLKTKDKDLRSVAFSSALTAFVGGVTEPALFGVTLRFKKIMYSIIAGGFAGGLYMGFMNVGRYAYGPSGIFGLSVFVAENSMNLLHACIGIVIGMVTTFIVGMLIAKPDELK